MKKLKMYRIGIRQRKAELTGLLLIVVIIVMLIVMIINEMNSKLTFKELYLNQLQFSKMKKIQRQIDFQRITDFGTGLGLVYS